MMRRFFAKNSNGCLSLKAAVPSIRYVALASCLGLILFVTFKMTQNGSAKRLEALRSLDAALKAIPNESEVQATFGNEEWVTGSADYIKGVLPFGTAADRNDKRAVVAERAINAWYWGYERNERGYLLIRQAAVLGHGIALAELAKPYWWGQGVAQDRARAQDLARQALPELRDRAEAGEPHAQYLLGWYYGEDELVFEEDYGKEVEWYRRAAEQGYAPAQNDLGVSYEFGDGVSLDNALAAEWYRKAAEQGYADAQYGLGFLYHSGKTGVAHNEKLAAKWYRKAAVKGVPEAQAQLAYLYEHGKGVEKNYPLAIRWYRAVAQGGNSFSQNSLGEKYEEGRIVGKDLDAAIKWYRKAARQGHGSAQENLQRLNMDW